MEVGHVGAAAQAVKNAVAASQAQSEAGVTASTQR
jgi:hypothetical protein